MGSVTVSEASTFLDSDFSILVAQIVERLLRFERTNQVIGCIAAI